MVSQDCSFKIAGDGPETEAVLETGRMFYDKFKAMCENENMQNVRYHIDVLLLGLIIPDTAHYIFCRLGQDNMVDRFVFSILPGTQRTPKLNYNEQLLYFEFVKEVMQRDLFKMLY